VIIRLWTLHPRYLDPKGLVALWREALLAQKVLHGETAGYREHPQLLRFREQEDPLGSIAGYLDGIYRESLWRGYSFDRSKIQSRPLGAQIEENEGQLLYEWEHLKSKLQKRSPGWFAEIAKIESPEPHPLFRIVPGPISSWERVGKPD
jgi:pyrimidine dimer DNA glycosylase